MRRIIAFSLCLACVAATFVIADDARQTPRPPTFTVPGAATRTAPAATAEATAEAAEETGEEAAEVQPEPEAAEPAPAEAEVAGDEDAPPADQPEETA